MPGVTEELENMMTRFVGYRLFMYHASRNTGALHHLIDEKKIFSSLSQGCDNIMPCFRTTARDAGLTNLRSQLRPRLLGQLIKH